MNQTTLTHSVSPPPAHVQPAPAVGWEALADAMSQREEQAERDGWAQLRDAHQAHLAWVAAGSPGGSFYTALNDRQEHLGRKPFSKTRVYSWLRGGEALDREINCATIEEAVQAGYALQKQLEGSTIPEAVAAVQEQVNAGKLKRKANPSAPQGCTFRAVPLAAVDTLEALEERVARLAERRGGEVPGGSPERLATIITAVSALEDEALEALMGGGEHLLVRVDVLSELQRRAGLAERAGLVDSSAAELEGEA